MYTMLITGFGPWGGVTYSPTALFAKELDGMTLTGAGKLVTANVVGSVLDVAWADGTHALPVNAGATVTGAARALALMPAHTRYQSVVRSVGPSEPISAEFLPLDHAELRSERRLAALGAREQGPKNAKPEAEARSRAYTLFVRAHVEVRRVISFLRWHEDDLDAFFPTVFGGKSKPEAVNKSGSQSGEESDPSLTDRGGGDGRPSPLPAGPDGKAVPGGLAGGEPFDS